MKICRSVGLGITIWSIIFWSIAVSAQDQIVTFAAAEGRVVEDIIIHGLRRTQAAVVQRELLISPGQPFDGRALQQSVQRLKNLRIFSDVDVSLTRRANTQDDSVIVVLTLQEIWTTIPVLKVTEGGDTTYVVAGVYDVNVAGKYLELGAQYENWNGEAGGVVWFRNPRFLGRRLRLGADVWSVKRPRDLYEADGAEQGSFVLQRNRFNLFLEREFSRRLTVGLGLAMNDDSLIAPAIKGDLNDATLMQLQNDKASTSVLSRAYLRLGRLDYDNYLLRGARTELSWAQAIPSLGSDEDFYRAEWDNQIFWQLPYEANLAARLRLGTTNSDALQHLFYIGGFEHVRGYLDGQLRGKRYWQANLEYRVPSFRWPWVVLQLNAFFDVAQVTKASQDAGPDRDDVFYSTGIGLRIISPKIHRFIGRLDIALDTSHPATSRFSFGVQQFF